MKSSFFAITNYNLSLTTLGFLIYLQAIVRDTFFSDTSYWPAGTLPIVCGIVVTLIFLTITAWICYTNNQSVGALFCSFTFLYSQLSTFCLALFLTNFDVKEIDILAPWNAICSIFAILYLISYFKQKRLNNQ